MEIFTNWMNNLVAKPSFHSLIKKIPIIRRLALHDGKIISSGSSELLLNDSDVRRVYLGEKFKL